MFDIVETPEPPYWAVIAPAVLADDTTGYPEEAMRVLAAAREVDGFLGLEAAIQGGFALAVSYWRSREAIDAWRRHARHVVAKDLGRTRWFAAYFTRIARVERHY